MMWVRARLLPLAALSIVAFMGCAAQRQAEPTSTPTYGGAPAGAAPRAEPPAQQPGYPGSAPGYGQQPSPPGAVGSTTRSASKDEDRELDRLEDAEAALAEARTQLETLTGLARDRTKSDDVELKKKSSEPPAKSPARKPKGGAEATELAQGDARCAEACKAFASLRRAADAVCRLTSETDARCTKARSVVEESRKRVQVCRCEENEK